MTLLQIRILAVALLVLAVVGAVLGYGHHKYNQGVEETTARYEAALNKQKAEAAATLASETAKTRAVEQALTDFKANQEKTDVEHQTAVADLRARLVAAAGPAGRLRDPNAGRGPSCSGTPAQAATPAGAGAGDGAQTNGLLSAELTGLLQRLQLEADTVNDAYASCRPVLLNQTLNQPANPE